MEITEATIKKLNAVFVLSTGRVGTTTLTELLSSLPEVMSLHEPKPLLLDASANAYAAGGWDNPNTKDFTSTLIKARSSLWSKAIKQNLL